LTTHAEISAAVVVAHGTDIDRRLVGYVVPADSADGVPAVGPPRSAVAVRPSGERQDSRLCGESPMAVFPTEDIVRLYQRVAAVPRTPAYVQDRRMQDKVDGGDRVDRQSSLGEISWRVDVCARVLIQIPTAGEASVTGEGGDGGDAGWGDLQMVGQ
jgi:hypothetical protein